MNYSSIAQLGLLVISFAIFFTYIQPTIGKIKEVQDETFAYTDAVEKANQFNAHLNGLLEQVNSFRESDIQALETYLPDSVDALTVMADIEAIASDNNVIVTAITATEDEDGAPNAGGEVQFEDEVIEVPSISSRDFTVTFSGSYEDMKRLLADVERNKYLLEIVKFNFGAVADSAAVTVTDAAVSEGSYSMVLRAYAYAPQVAVAETYTEDGAEEFAE